MDAVHSLRPLAVQINFTAVPMVIFIFFNYIASIFFQLQGLSCDIKAGRCIGKSYDLLLTQLSTSHIVNKNHDKSVKKLQHRDSWPVKNMTRQYFYVQCLFAYVYEQGVPQKRLLRRR